MKKWEQLYEKYNSEEFKQRSEEIKAKIDNRTASLEEIKEWKRIEKIEQNLPKVENLMEYMKELDSNLEKLKTEYAAREEQEGIQQENINIANLDKEIIENLNKRNTLVVKRKEVKNQIATLEDKKNRGEISDDELEKLTDLTNERDSISNQIEELEQKNVANNENFVRSRKSVDERAKSSEESKNWALNKFSKDQLRKECFATAAQISKCEMAAGLLLKGYAMENVQLKMNDFKERKFTSDTKLPLTKKERAQMQAKKEAEKPTEKIVIGKKDLNKDENLDKEDFEKNDIYDERSLEDEISRYYDKNVKGAETNKLPKKVNEFEKAFPKLSKVFPKLGERKLGKALLKIKQKFAKEEVEDEEIEENKIENVEKVEEVKVEEVKEEPKIVKEEIQKESSGLKPKRTKDTFRLDLRNYNPIDVAQKGMDEAEKNYREELHQKLENKDDNEKQR